MPTPSPRPAPDDSTRIPLCDISLRDAEGTDIRLGCRVEQVVVDKKHGALPDRLHQQGEVIGQSAHLVFVRFDYGHQGMIALRPHLVRVLTTPDGY